MNKGNILTILVVALLVLAGVWYIQSNQTSQNSFQPADSGYSFEIDEIKLENIEEQEGVTPKGGDEVKKENTQEPILSSDAYVNQYAYSRGTRIVNNKNIFSVDIVSDVFFDTPYPGAIGTVVNKNLKTRDYLITQNTCFSSFPDNSCNFDKNINIKPAERNNELLLIDTNADGEVIKIFTPGP